MEIFCGAVVNLCNLLYFCGLKNRNANHTGVRIFHSGMFKTGILLLFYDYVDTFQINALHSHHIVRSRNQDLTLR